MITCRSVEFIVNLVSFCNRILWNNVTYKKYIKSIERDIQSQSLSNMYEFSFVLSDVTHVSMIIWISNEEFDWVKRQQQYFYGKLRCDWNIYIDRWSHFHSTLFLTTVIMHNIKWITYVATILEIEFKHIVFETENHDFRITKKSKWSCQNPIVSFLWMGHSYTSHTTIIMAKINWIIDSETFRKY